MLSRSARRGPQWRRLATAAVIVGGLGLAQAAWRITRDHPHQQVYFSILPPSFSQTHFDLDYWGLSYRQGLEWVLAHDPATVIRVSVAVPQPPVEVPYGEHLLYMNSLILPPADRARLRFTDDNTLPTISSPPIVIRPTLSQITWARKCTLFKLMACAFCPFFVAQANSYPWWLHLSDRYFVCLASIFLLL